jgi:hypothetical protein
MSDASIRHASLAAALAALAVALSGCRVIGDIFKAGVWVGVLAIAILVAMIGGLAAMLRRHRRA